jgi:SAM-dependent methyltransferase
MDLKETSILGPAVESHWYYRSKARAMRALLGNVERSTILDVGAGSGYFSRYLLQNTGAEASWCVDTSYPDNSDECYVGKSVHLRRAVGETPAQIVLLMDVLEHVDDDLSLLEEYVSKVPAGSIFLISVPAFEFLWSGHDEFLDHKRRYRIDQVKELVRAAGLRVDRSCYFFGAVFPIAAAIRLAKKLLFLGRNPRSELKKHHPAVNRLLETICRAELPFMKLNRLAGLTVFCLARK